MPKFPENCLQKLRNAGLTVLSGAYDEMNDDQVESYQGKITVKLDKHRLWMFSHEGKWCVESYGPEPGDFVTQWPTPEEAVEDALTFFGGDERFQLKEKFYKYQKNL